MKNIHILPTDKPSRLLKNTQYNTFWLSTEFLHREVKRGVEQLQYQNIYITSDEEIKEGIDQWYLDKVLNEPYNSGGAQYASKQDVIILTTDQDLIKDGVQAIDDEFLEWFVKNPSCERVETVFACRGFNGTIPNLIPIGEYKIIIPSEEPKQIDEKGRPMTYWGGLEEPKQETLEEAAEDFWLNDDSMTDNDRISYVNGFLACAQWQQKRSYSEEEVIAFGEFIFKHTLLVNVKGVEAIFEQFKKK